MRIAVLLFKKNKRYKQAIELSKNDKMYSDAMQTARESDDTEVVDNLLKFFVNNNEKECFAAALYVCYDLVSPDIVLELAWRANMMDFCMPYLIQVVKEYTTRLDALDKRRRRRRRTRKKRSRHRTISWPTTSCLASPVPAASVATRRSCRRARRWAPPACRRWACSHRWACSRRWACRSLVWASQG